MGAVKTYAEHYTVEEWTQWQDKWELIEGMPYCMIPTHSFRHQDINGKIYAEFLNEFKKKSCKHCKVVLPIDWQVTEDTVVQPDLLIICKPFFGKRLTEVPKAIFEILSPSTKQKDRTVKFDLYQAQKVKHYTMVDPETESVEIFTLGEDGLYQKAESGPEFTYTFDDCQITIDFRKIWED